MTDLIFSDSNCTDQDCNPGASVWHGVAALSGCSIVQRIAMAFHHGASKTAYVA